MAMYYFHTALPDSMSIEQAVQTMIEGDARIKLPICYETIGLPFFDRLEECMRILEKLIESALDHDSDQSQNAAIANLSTFQDTHNLAQLYKNDLQEHVRLSGDKLIARDFLIPWALEVHDCDIFGTSARAHSAVQNTNNEDEPALQDTDIASHSQAQQVEFSNGQKIFYCMAHIFDALLTLHDGDWRKIIADETDETSGTFLKAGNLNYSAYASAVAEQLPLQLSKFGTSTTPTKQAKTLIGYLLCDPAPIPNGLSPQAKPLAQMSLYALTQALWMKKTGNDLPDQQKCEYPINFIEAITAALPQDFLLSDTELTLCLTKARQEAIRQRDKSDAKSNPNK